MSRVYQNLTEAALEIRRDLAKGTKVEYSRVQQHAGMNIPGRERQGYEYVIMNGGIPHDAVDLVILGKELGIKVYEQHSSEMLEWLMVELDHRLHPYFMLDRPPTEEINPLLKGAIEGNYPSYTYRERMTGAAEAVVAALRASADTRRAYWPIFLPVDAQRAPYATRIPCSLGYEVMLRQVGHQTMLQTFYLQRACDFDRFWLSDVWFAYRFGHMVAKALDAEPGAVYHYIISLHSFDVELKEVY